MTNMQTVSASAHRIFDFLKNEEIPDESKTREDLVYNTEGITGAQLEEVLRACGLDKFVHTLPPGL